METIAVVLGPDTDAGLAGICSLLAEVISPIATTIAAVVATVAPRFGLNARSRL